MKRLDINTRQALLTLFTGLLICLGVAGCSDERQPAEGGPQAAVNRGNFEDEPESPVISDCSPAASRCFEVLDCSDNDGCVTRHITFDVDECAKQEDRRKCENFAGRLQDVTLVSDAYNFIDTPFTQQALDVELVARLDRPWDIEFLPDGSLLATQVSGEILHIRDGEVTEIEHDLEVLLPPGTGGLLGLAVDPGFADNHFIYVVYTYAYFEELDPDAPYDRRLINRVSRLTLENGKLVDEFVLLDRTPASLQHAGSRLKFGPDGKLYVTTGDADQDAMSQLFSFHGGKILRLNPDGSVPRDNPLPSNYIYSLGHRNPQGLAWHPETGELFASEHGPKRYDEINRIVPGGNYGWGSYRCEDRSMWGRRKPAGDYIFPVVCPKHWNLSPSGMTFVDDPDSPWHGSLFVTSLRGKHLHRYVINDGQVEVDEIFYVVDNDLIRTAGNRRGMSLRMRDVEYHDGALYVIGDTSGLIRISPAQD